MSSISSPSSSASFSSLPGQIIIGDATANSTASTTTGSTANTSSTLARTILEFHSSSPGPIAVSHSSTLSAGSLHIQEGDQRIFDVFSMKIKESNLQEIQNKLDTINTLISKNAQDTIKRLDAQKVTQFKKSMDVFSVNSSKNPQAKGIVTSINSILKSIEPTKAVSLSVPTTGSKVEAIFSSISSGSSVAASSIPPSITSATSASARRVYEVPAPNPINKDNLQTWVDAHQDNVKNAVQALADSINYVSHQKFIDNLAKTLAKFKQFARMHAPFTYVSAVQAGKSNKWVSDLAMSLLDKEFHHQGEVPLVYASYLTPLINKVIQGESTKFPENIVLFDDAVYTGEQMSRIIQSIIGATNRANETLKKAEKPLIQHPRIIVACPFMAAHGRDRLEKIGYCNEKGDSLLVILCVENIPTIAEALKEKPTERAVLQKMYWNQRSSPAGLSEKAHLQISSASRPSGIYSVCLTYFDHKVPDWLSFPQALVEGSVYDSQGNDLGSLPDTDRIIEQNKSVYR